MVGKAWPCDFESRGLMARSSPLPGRFVRWCSKGIDVQFEHVLGLAACGPAYAHIHGIHTNTYTYTTRRHKHVLSKANTYDSERARVKVRDSME